MSGNISTATPAWFARGFMAGILACAAVNALSYFARSEGWGNLLGTHQVRREAIGFPVEMWEEGNAYGGFFVDYPSMLANVGLALGVGAALGLLAVTWRRRLNRLVADLEEQFAEQGPRRSFQFSMRGLLASTLLVALAATGLRHWLAGRPEALGAIYLLGPWLLVGLAMLPRRIPWEQRVGLIIPLTMGLVLVAVAVGTSLPAPRSFDQVLMGIFVCWTPQAAVAALAMTAALLVSQRSSLLKPVQETV